MERQKIMDNHPNNRELRSLALAEKEEILVDSILANCQKHVDKCRYCQERSKILTASLKGIAEDSAEPAGLFIEVK